MCFVRTYVPWSGFIWLYLGGALSLSASPEASFPGIETFPMGRHRKAVSDASGPGEAARRERDAFVFERASRLERARRDAAPGASETARVDDVVRGYRAYRAHLEERRRASAPLTVVRRAVDRHDAELTAGTRRRREAIELARARLEQERELAAQRREARARDSLAQLRAESRRYQKRRARSLRLARREERRHLRRLKVLEAARRRSLRIVEAYRRRSARARAIEEERKQRIASRARAACDRFADAGLDALTRHLARLDRALESARGRLRGPESIARASGGKPRSRKGGQAPRRLREDEAATKRRAGRLAPVSA